MTTFSKDMILPSPVSIQCSANQICTAEKKIVKPKLHFFANFGTLSLYVCSSSGTQEVITSSLFLMKNNVFCVFFPGQMQLHHQLVQLQP